MSERLENIKYQKITSKKPFFSKKSKYSEVDDRQIKRKRRKIKYYKTFKKPKFSQSTKDITSSVELFNINDMDSAPSSSQPAVPSEVLEWQRQDQLSYWKSRAISLEYENQMLRQHLRNVYAKTVETQSQFCPTQETVCETNESSWTSATGSHEKCEKKEDHITLPNIPNVKCRIDEMSQLYGEKAHILMGMETAMQLNFEKHLENSNPVLWPSLPLKLTFDD